MLICMADEYMLSQRNIISQSFFAVKTRYNRILFYRAYRDGHYKFEGSEHLEGKRIRKSLNLQFCLSG
jgi:hypothetical protein